jgi:hypothetical protein
MTDPDMVADAPSDARRDVPASSERPRTPIVRKGGRSQQEAWFSGAGLRSRFTKGRPGAAQLRDQNSPEAQEEEEQGQRAGRYGVWQVATFSLAGVALLAVAVMVLTLTG